MRVLSGFAAVLLGIGALNAAGADALPDVDSLAKRLPFGQDTYRQECDATLAVFAAQHPGQHPYDAEARQALKLGVYLALWGDYYEEGLWSLEADQATHLQVEGCPDLLWRCIVSRASFVHRHSSDNDDAQRLNDLALNFARGPYPPFLKITFCQVAIKNLVAAENDPKVGQTIASSAGHLPDLAAATATAFTDLLKTHPSHLAIYRLGHDLMHATEKDEATLNALHGGLDQAFSAAAPGNAQSSVLDAEFDIADAWNARGTGYANTVTPESGALFDQRLAAASKTLEEVNGRAPTEPGVALSMLTVCLGEGQPLTVMEDWFRRGQKVEGDPYALAYSKATYLQPKWHGSDESLWNFCLECGRGANWAGKVPLIVEDGIHERAVHETAIFARPDIWDPLEQMFRGYLTHYPNSVHYRSLFALEAAFGGHWDTAREQFTILGDAWDPQICGEGTHQKMKSQALSR